MPRRRRASLLQKTSVAIQHSDSLVSTIGGASAPTEHVLLVTNNARTTTGAAQSIQDGGTTGEGVQIGSQTKYLNIFIQACTRPSASTADERTGWLEYALLMNKESDTTIPITQLGTNTLGDVATKMYRNECIWTGNFPVADGQPNSAELHIKVPKFKQKIRIGDEWKLYCYFRSSVTTSASTTAIRLMTSTIYKNYQ